MTDHHHNRRTQPNTTHPVASVPLHLGVGLLISVGVALSTLSSTAIAQSATDAGSDANVLPAVKISAGRDMAPLKVETVSGGALGTRKQVDTPFSTHAVSSEEGEDLMASTANDLFKYDPAVTNGGSNMTGENSFFSVRGIQIDFLNGIKVDGQSYPAWDTELALEPFEQVELLKGLSGFMYGFGAPGGIVNYVLKRPTDDPYRSFSVGYQSAGIFSEKLDVGGRFGKDDRFGYRFNLANEEGNTAEANGHVRRQAASLAVDFRITPDLTWTMDGLYQKRKTNGTLFGIYLGSGVGVPDAGAISRDLTQPQNFYQTEMASFGTGLEYKISPNWKANIKYRFAKENRTESDSQLSVFNNAGDYTNTLYAALTRYFYQNVDAMVQGTFNTGSIKHDVVVGAGFQTQSSEYDNSTGWNDGYDLGTGNLYNSTLLTNSEVNIGGNMYRQSRTTQAALYASDTAQLTSRLSALVGVRYTQFREHVYDPSGAVSSQYSADPVSPTFALMFKTDPYSTLYTSYVESLQQGGAAGNTNANFPTTFGPLKSKQYEVGFKTDRKHWGANVALFRVNQGYEYTNTANQFVQDGRKQYTGVDASGWYQLAQDWRVMGGVMWLDAKSVDVDDPSVDGKQVYSTPRFTATGRVEYNPSYMRRLTLALGGKYVGGMAVDAANTQFVPAYTTFDASAKYETRIGGEDVTFRAGVNNLLNRHYWMSSWGYFVLPSATRTFVANATLVF